MSVAHVSLWSWTAVQKGRTVDVAEAAGFAFLRVMQASSVIDCNVAFFSIQTRCTLHTASSTDRAELEEAVKDRTVITNVELSLLLPVVVHVVWRHSVQEVDVLIGVELGHLEFVGWLRALQMPLEMFQR